MKKQLLKYVALCGFALLLPPAEANAKEFSFGVIVPSRNAAMTEPALREAIDQADADNLAFVVANGIKAAGEPCSDRLYNDRKALLQTAKKNLIVSLAANDWAKCAGENGKSSAIGRLNRVRELFFTEEFSFDGAGIPLVRQSATAKFRSYVENARWEMGNIMFATLNLPGNNNHYVFDAGRNSEFEDRLIANRDWLHRVYIYAMRKKLAGIVLFCDGNPLPLPANSEDNSARRDGFVETRRYITNLAAKFPGKILVIHNAEDGHANAPPAIVWRRNLGELALGPGSLKLTADSSSRALFAVANETAQAANHRP